MLMIYKRNKWQRKAIETMARLIWLILFVTQKSVLCSCAEACNATERNIDAEHCRVCYRYMCVRCTSTAQRDSQLLVFSKWNNNNKCTYINKTTCNSRVRLRKCLKLLSMSIQFYIISNQHFFVRFNFVYSWPISFFLFSLLFAFCLRLGRRTARLGTSARHMNFHAHIWADVSVLH